MRAVIVVGVLGLVVGYSAALVTREPPSAAQRQEECLRPALQHLTFDMHKIRGDLRRDLWCALPMSQQKDDETVFNFLVVVMHAYDSSLEKEFSALGEEMDANRRDIAAGVGCNGPDH